MRPQPKCTGYAARGRDGKLYKGDTPEAARKAADKADIVPDQLADAKPKGKGKGKSEEEVV
jgi:hypothetical protein